LLPFSTLPFKILIQRKLVKISLTSVPQYFQAESQYKKSYHYNIVGYFLHSNNMSVSEAWWHRKQNKEQLASDSVLMQCFSHFISSLSTLALKRGCCYIKKKRERKKERNTKWNSLDSGNKTWFEEPNIKETKWKIALKKDL